MNSLNITDAIARIGDREMFLEIAKVFAAHLPEYITTINTHVANGDAENATRIIHSVKSNCATVGAEKLREAFATLEQTSRSADLATVQEEMARLAPFLLELKTSLEAL